MSTIQTVNPIAMNPVIQFGEMKRRNAAAGGSWFGKDEMRFFNTRLLGSPNRYGMFVTSEKPNDNSPRMYSIRAFVPATNQIATIGDFRRIGSESAAYTLKERIAARLDELQNDADLIRVFKNLHTGEWKDGKLILWSIMLDNKQYSYELSI